MKTKTKPTAYKFSTNVCCFNIKAMEIWVVLRKICYNCDIFRDNTSHTYILNVSLKYSPSNKNTYLMCSETLEAWSCFYYINSMPFLFLTRNGFCTYGYACVFERLLVIVSNRIFVKIGNNKKEDNEFISIINATNWNNSPISKTFINSYMSSKAILAKKYRMLLSKKNIW